MTPQEKLALIRQLSTGDGFTRKFYEVLGGGVTQIDAFAQVNALHKQLFGREKYANYNSYRSVRDYQRKKTK
jgi:hypothetical protein